jgi:hypothetical protein
MSDAFNFSTAAAVSEVFGAGIFCACRFTLVLVF